MKNGNSGGNSVPYLTKGSVLDDLGFSPSEALEIKVKAEIYRELLLFIRQQGISAQELAVILGMHQPDVSKLLNGKISKFSVGKLIQFAGKLQLGAQVKLTKPKVPGRVLSSASEKQKRIPLPSARATGSHKAKTNA